MKASRLILAALALGSGLGLTACETVTRHHSVSASQVAQGCLEYAEGSAAPEIMTYDPYTHVETHVLEAPKGAAVTVQDRGNNRVTAVSAEHVGDSGYPLCTADGRPRDYASTRVVGPNPVIVGTIAGAVVGAAVTKSGKGAQTGAVIGATMGSALSNSDDSNAISLGAGTGALIGAAAGGTDTAAAGAVAGAIIGLEAKKKGHDDHDDDDRRR